MTDRDEIRQLVQDAIAAARSGDSAGAREILEGVVKRDPENEKAWFWLASVAENNDRRRMYLGNVVQINPYNERAQMLLEKLEAMALEETPQAAEDEILPGISRKYAIYGGAVVAILIVLVCVLVGITIANNNQQAANEQATQAAFRLTDEVRIQAQQTIDFDATQVALANIVTATPLAPTLPPTWTPAAPPTSAMAVTMTPLAPAVGNPLFSGRLIANSGRDVTGFGFSNVAEINLDGSPGRVLFEGHGGAANLAPRGDMVTYVRFSPGTREQGIEFAALGSIQQPRLLTQLLGGRILSDQDDPGISPDGNGLVFSAALPGNLRRDIFAVSLLALGGVWGTESVPPEMADLAFNQVTRGDGDSYAPSWADSSRILFVEDTRQIGGDVDIKLIWVDGTMKENITSDGNLMIEDNPVISPDGMRVAFDAYSPDNPDDIDIYVVPLSGGEPMLTVDSDGKDIRPRWSPDGRFLAYSTDHTGGGWEIFIVDVTTYANYQVTVNDFLDIVHDWVSVP